MKREEIVVRDPFIFPYNGKYLMTGTMQPDRKKQGIYGCISENLEDFSDPILLFDPSEDFWGDRDFWAPEIHYYKGRYYMFVSFRSLSRRRATQVLVADNPVGPYKPMGKEAHTPAKWHCLDGTLFIDKEGNPWMVYVREWVQMVDGEIYAQRLSENLTHLEGNPVRLFCATWASWCVTNEEGGMPFENQSGGYITDGPFIFTLPDGKLGMLWSSFCSSGYCQAVCYNASGKITGSWKQMDKPLYEHDSGHGMLFVDLEGKLRLVLHNHNRSENNSHPVFLYVTFSDGQLKIC